MLGGKIPHGQKWSFPGNFSQAKVLRAETCAKCISTSLRLFNQSCAWLRHCAKWQTPSPLTGECVYANHFLNQAECLDWNPKDWFSSSTKLSYLGIFWLVGSPHFEPRLAVLQAGDMRVRMGMKVKKLWLQWGGGHALALYYIPWNLCYICGNIMDKTQPGHPKAVHLISA
jgi:hypothetical protein